MILLLSHFVMYLESESCNEDNERTVKKINRILWTKSEPVLVTKLLHTLPQFI